jgi:hypothetical protein
MNSDVRGRFAYSFVIVYTNSVVMPQMLAQSTCGTGGKYNAFAACKLGLTKPYSSIPFIAINILYWVTVLPMLQYEKGLAQNAKKVMAVVLNYYDNLQSFLNDSKFENHYLPKFDEDYCKMLKEKKSNASPTPPHHPKNGETPQKGKEMRETALAMSSAPIPLEFTDPKFIKDYFQILNSTQYVFLMERYELFEKEKLIPKENPQEEEQLCNDDPKRHDTIAAYHIIKKYVLEPNNLLTPQVKDDLCTLDFYYRRIIKSPPALWSIIGLICGFIFPFNTWFFDPLNNPLPTFIGTVQTIGGMMSPISMFLLGTYLAQASYVTSDMLIQWKHVIISNIVRNIMLPLIGYFWMFVVLDKVNEHIFKTNPVLMMMLYTLWMVPNGIVLIGVYVVADYYAKEFAVLSVYLNLIAIPMMAIFLIIYFILYENKTGP